MKKILVYYSYSQKNAGDMAICFGLLDLLSELKDCQVTMVSRYSAKDPLFEQSVKIIKKYHPNVIIKPGYIAFDRAGSFFSKLIAYIKGFFLSMFPSWSKRLKSDVLDNDCVLFNGGNYLRANSLTDRLRIRALFTPLKYAKKHKKRIICMPQSTAKAKSKKSLRLLRKICSIFDHIFIRDPISYSYLVHQKVCNEKKLTQSCDLAFFTKNSYVCQTKNVSTGYKPMVAINARITGIGDIGFISEDKIELIKTVYKDLISNNKNCDFSLVCQTEKDQPFMKQLFDSFKNDYEFDNVHFYKSDDAYELKNIYAQHSLLISMRLHASILAISSNVPVIGFAFDEWGFKNKGILNQFQFYNYLTYDDIQKEMSRLLACYDSKMAQETICHHKKTILDKLSKIIVFNTATLDIK